MLMMRPQPRCFMAGRARRIRWNGADRLTARAASHRSGGNCSTGAKCRTTALFTRMSIEPRRSSRSFIMVSIDAGCVRSAPTLTASMPWRARRRSLVSLGSIRSCRTTLTPAPARLSATASPRPLVAPVTRAHLPFSIALALSLTLGPEWLGERQLWREDCDGHAGLPLHDGHAGAETAALVVEFEFAERIIFRGTAIHRAQRVGGRDAFSLASFLERLLDQPHVAIGGDRVLRHPRLLVARFQFVNQGFMALRAPACDAGQHALQKFGADG